MKKERQDKLLDLIAHYEINTQDELIARLREQGFHVTQATVSRDIRELKIAKMTAGEGAYRYVRPRQDDGGGMTFSKALIESIVSVEAAQNLVVLKTYPGLASAVAAGIDRMNQQQILGCVAGDDTILVVTRDLESAGELSGQMHHLLKEV